ncbi:hypothetical protein OM416_28880 [Paenibacillus sp. LS1]|uniref:hypothetical protein n=1 Tax=Paenibacillus sp. LS1 TaxID=2992120 RepID=UPI00223297D6|nr:hypothetical protein [Paenibacillus sp. LS1]MCW3795622.1 hypothetical protein [Paenibacillus sp. LS1]
MNAGDADWNKPFEGVHDFASFLKVIENWGNLDEGWEQYNPYGLMAILSTCLEQIGHNFLDDEVDGLHEHLRDEHIQLLIRIGRSLEQTRT